MTEAAFESPPFLGITVLGDFLLSEGPDAVLDNLLAIGATAVACNPTVTSAARDGEGSFQPPSDAGSSPRLFDRPLFGKRALWVRSGVSYVPRAEFYRDSPYRPRQPNDLTQAHGQLIGEFIARAVSAGLKVYLQVGAAQPTGLRDEDCPRLPDGTLPTGRVADVASLASSAVQAYNAAYVRDLLAAYPQITGFRPDWPEYPCYTPDEVFQDFGEHVRRWATERQIDFESIRQDVLAFQQFLRADATSGWLHELTADTIRDEIGRRFPGVLQWLRLKSDLSCQMLQHWRDIIDAAGAGPRELSANAFMTPYSAVTGFDFSRAAEICDSIAPKLYTMHWSLMVQLWGEWLVRNNPALDVNTVAQALVRLLDLHDHPEECTADDYGYPAPDEPHPIPNAPQTRKIAQVLEKVGRRAAVYPLIHGYGPLDDFRRRLALVTESTAPGLWINRYGYLSDEKLQAIGELQRERVRRLT